MHIKNPMESLCTKMWSQPIGLRLSVTTKQELDFRLQRGPAFPTQSGEGGAARALLWVGKRSQPKASPLPTAQESGPWKQIPTQWVSGSGSCVPNSFVLLWGHSRHLSSADGTRRPLQGIPQARGASPAHWAHLTPSPGECH